MLFEKKKFKNIAIIIILWDIERNINRRVLQKLLNYTLSDLKRTTPSKSEYLSNRLEIKF